MARPETISKTIDYYIAEYEKFKSRWGAIPAGLAPELGRFYSTAPVRIMEMKLFEGIELPVRHEHSVNGLAHYCTELAVYQECAPKVQKDKLVGQTFRYILQSEAAGESGEKLLEFLQSLEWPYTMADIQDLCVPDFKRNVLTDLEEHHGTLPVAEKYLVLDLIDQYTANLTQTTGKKPMCYYCSPDIFSIAQILFEYGFKLSSPNYEYHSEAKHLLKQMEDCGNTKGLAELRKAMVKEPDKWIYERYK